jgi:hypothetical protein
VCTILFFALLNHVVLHFDLVVEAQGQGEEGKDREEGEEGQGREGQREGVQEAEELGQGDRKGSCWKKEKSQER